MDNLDNVIDGLKCCQYDSKSHCEECPYCNEGWIGHCTASLTADALDLLNEQDEKITEQQSILKEYEKLSQVCIKIEKYLKIADLSILIDRIEEGKIEVLQDDGRPDSMETTIKIRRK